MPMVARSPHEAHRAATPLELFFDLVFVVAIARAAAGLHHAIAEHHIAHGLLAFGMVFFAIWWAWMNFTWFASAYDCDDVPYRAATLVQMTGALIMAAGLPAMFDEARPNGTVVGGYIVMRLALVTQWLRAASADRPRRATALRYALGVAALQLLWTSLLWLPATGGFVSFVALVLGELAVPVWAERLAPTTWHPHHIAERYGLLTIIVLGESVLASTVAIDEALSGSATVAGLAPVIVGGLLILYSMWWIYFDRQVHDLLTGLRRAILWGYGHFLVFASAAAVGAGLAVSVDAGAGHPEIGAVTAGLAVTVPVVVYLLVLWYLHWRPEYGASPWLGPAVSPLVLATAFTGQAVLLTGVLLAGVVAVKQIARRPRSAPALGPPAVVGRK